MAILLPPEVLLVTGRKVTARALFVIVSRVNVPLDGTVISSTRRTAGKLPIAFQTGDVGKFVAVLVPVIVPLPEVLLLCHLTVK